MEEAVHLLFMFVGLVLILSILVTAIWFVASRKRTKPRDDDTSMKLRKRIDGIDKKLQVMNKNSYESLVAEFDSLRTMQQDVRSRLTALRAMVAQQQLQDSAASQSNNRSAAAKQHKLD